METDAKDQGENLCQGWDGWSGIVHKKPCRRGGFRESQKEEHMGNTG